MNDVPSHPDLRVVAHEIAFKRHLRLDVVRFHHRMFSGEWSGERVYDVVRRGAAVAILLYDPERDAVVLVEQFRLPPLFAGYSPWVVEVIPMYRQIPCAFQSRNKARLWLGSSHLWCSA